MSADDGDAGALNRRARTLSFVIAVLASTVLIGVATWSLSGGDVVVSEDVSQHARTLPPPQPPMTPNAGSSSPALRPGPASPPSPAEPSSAEPSSPPPPPPAAATPSRRAPSPDEDFVAPCPLARRLPTKPDHTHDKTIASSPKPGSAVFSRVIDNDADDSGRGTRLEVTCRSPGRALLYRLYHWSPLAHGTKALEQRDVRDGNQAVSFALPSDAEAFHVECVTDGGRSLGVNYHFVPQRVFRPPPRHGPVAPDDAWNVLVLLVDSVAHAKFHRTLWRTAALLDDVDARRVRGWRRIEMSRYNVIGYNSRPNKYPLLANTSFVQATDGYRHEPAGSQWIWDAAERAGFVSFYGDEVRDYTSWTCVSPGRCYDRYTPKYNTTTYHFPQQVIEHRLKLPGVARSLGPLYLHGQADMCRHMLDYVGRFWRRFPGRGKIGLLNCMKPFHNPGAASAQGLFDRWFSSKLESGVLRNRHIMDRTVVFFMSDHGLHYGKHYATPDGQLEHKLPFMNVLLPDAFASRYPAMVQALERNRDELVTTFDVYASMQHLLNLASGRQPSAPAPTRTRQSLFVPLPPNRRCSETDIELGRCACDHWRTPNKQQQGWIRANIAEAVVKQMNAAIAPYSDTCSRLELHRVVRSTVFDSSRRGDGSVLELYYVMIELTRPRPEKAQFQVQYEKRRDGSLGLASTSAPLVQETSMEAFPACERVKARRDGLNTQPFLLQQCLCHDNVYRKK